MQQITISKEAYDKMLIGLSMVALATHQATTEEHTDVKALTEALQAALTAADFPTI